jgi:carbon monoxide dehydrogenase subunit G
MAKFPAEAERSVTVEVPIRRAYEFLWDVVGSSRCFPGIESCSRVGAETYRFRYHEISIAGLSMAVRYTVRYRGNGKTMIEYESIAGDDDNTDVRGVIRLEQREKGETRITVRQVLAPDTPVPRLLQSLARSFVDGGAGRVLERYLDHVKHALEKTVEKSKPIARRTGAPGRPSRIG